MFENSVSWCESFITGDTVGLLADGDSSSGNCIRRLVTVSFKQETHNISIVCKQIDCNQSSLYHLTCASVRTRTCKNYKNY